MTFIVFGLKFRTQTQRRYLLVHENNGNVVIDKRSDSLDTIRREKRRLSNQGRWGRVILDKVTGEAVTP